MQISEKEIYTVLKEIGVPRSLKGYEYIKKGLCLMLKYPECKKAMRLYSDIAFAYGDKPQRVERAIRHAITRTFDIITPKASEKYFVAWDYNKSQPTNKEFFASIIEYLKNQV